MGLPQPFEIGKEGIPERREPQRESFQTYVETSHKPTLAYQCELNIRTFVISQDPGGGVDSRAGEFSSSRMSTRMHVLSFLALLFATQVSS